MSSLYSNKGGISKNGVAHSHQFKQSQAFVDFVSQEFQGGRSFNQVWLELYKSRCADCGKKPNRNDASLFVNNIRQRYSGSYSLDLHGMSIGHRSMNVLCFYPEKFEKVVYVDLSMNLLRDAGAATSTLIC